MAKKTTTKPDSLSNDTETKRKTVKSKKENDVKIETKITDETTSAPVNTEESKVLEEFTTPPTVVELARQIRSAEDLMKFGENGDVCEKEEMDEVLKTLNDIAGSFDNAGALRDYRDVYLKKYNKAIERNVDSDINAMLGILVSNIKNDFNTHFIDNLTSENYDKLFTAFKNALFISEILFSKAIRPDMIETIELPHMHGYAGYESERWENDTVKASVRIYPRLSICCDGNDENVYVLRYTPNIVRAITMKNAPEAEPEIRMMIPGEVIVKFSRIDSKFKYCINANAIAKEFGNIFDIFKHVTYLEEKMNHLNCITCQKRCKVPDCCFLYEDKVFANDKEKPLVLTAKIKNGCVKVSEKVINFLRVNEFVKEDVLCFAQSFLNR